MFIRCFLYGLCFLCYALKILSPSFLYSFCGCMFYLLDEYLWSLEERKTHDLCTSFILYVVNSSNSQLVGQKHLIGGQQLVVFLCRSGCSCCPLQSLSWVLSFLFLFCFISTFLLLILLHRTHKFRRISVAAENY